MSSGECKPQPERPTLLKPPETIVSPPSPTDIKTSHSPTFPSPTAYDSPESDGDSDHKVPPPKRERRIPSPRPRGPSDNFGSLSPRPVAADDFSRSPQAAPALLGPDTPGPSSRPRSPSPSSPHYRPRPAQHRRASSTHQVRETMNGEARSTESGDRMVNQYKIGRPLGRGAYATVESAVDVGTGTEYAMKEFSKSRLHLQALQEKHRQGSRSRMRRPEGGAVGEEGRRKAEDEEKTESLEGQDGDARIAREDPLGLIRREIAVMKKLDHPNIVHLHEAISVSSTDSLFLVLEYLSGGVLMDIKLGAEQGLDPPFETWQSREFFRQLCLGVEYLHANEVVHRDIKPDNILLSADRQVVKLCDFGVSEMFTAQGDDRIKKSGGSPAFLSPESFTAHAGDVHGKAVDIWALGVTLYCMLTGHLPFNVSNPVDLMDLVRKRDPPIPSEWDDDLKDLIQHMLDKEPAPRYGMSTIREHPWTTQNGEEPMIGVDDNLYFIGKHVEEPTQEELKSAIGTLKGVFTVIRAVQKMRRLQLRHRSMSGNSHSPDTSTTPSLTSGSMDSYASQPGGTEATASSENDEDVNDKWREIAGDAVLSPQSMEEEEEGHSPGTERQSSNPFDRLKPLTMAERGETKEDTVTEDEGTVVFGSPTSVSEE